MAIEIYSLDQLNKLIREGGLDINQPTISNWPRFTAVRNTNQAIASAGPTKIEFDTSKVAHEDYDNVTNFDFIPSQAGAYVLSTWVNVTGLTDQEVCVIRINKNVTAQVLAKGAGMGAGGFVVLSICAVVLANGVDDDFTVQVDSVSDTSYTVLADSGFSGWRIA